MMELPRPIQRQTDVFGSELAAELGMAAASFLGALAVLRLLLLVFGVTDRVWAGATVYGITDPIVWLLTLVPGGTRRVAGDATFADLAAVAVVVLAPLFFLARRRSR